jgi:nicotinate-nucleotide adenylyltransferase
LVSAVYQQSNTSMQRVGLFGGSFNPVHVGHLLVAQAALEEVPLSRLFFIPAAQSPFKLSAKMAPAQERLRLLHLALAGHSSYEVDPREVLCGGISYTIQTVREYAKRFPGDQLFYLIGADLVNDLPKWHSADELAQLVEFLVIPRPGEPFLPLPAPFRGRPLRGFPLGISSSQIRERVKAGLPIDLLMGPAVAEAIRNNGLYL